VKRILIVDDEENILKSLSGPLEREGYAVTTASTFADAVAANDGEFDLLLLDVWLPDGDGVKLLNQFRDEYPDQQVIMMSGHSAINTAVAAVKAGAYDFLEKPLSLEKVLVAIENALRLKGLARENVELRRAIGRKFEFVGESDAGEDMRAKIDLAAGSTARVLIRGESGTGKEVVAREIHARSDRRGLSFVPVNCAAIPDELIESELFGHKKGAFTGATASRVGKFEEAHEGTIFLDEIGDMNLRAQAKLLRVIEEGVVERLGGGRIEVDVRIVAATNRNLERLIESEKFREDLYYRLNVFTIDLPPLRDRKDDIPVLADHFVRLLCDEYGKRPVKNDRAARSALAKLPLRGNARELKNIVEMALISNGFTDITPANLPDQKSLGRTGGLGMRTLRDAVEQYETDLIRQAIEGSSGNMSEAARRLGLERSHLYKKMTALGIEKND